LLRNPVLGRYFPWIALGADIVGLKTNCSVGIDWSLRTLSAGLASSGGLWLFFRWGGAA